MNYQNGCRTMGRAGDWGPGSGGPVDGGGGSSIQLMGQLMGQAMGSEPKEDRRQGEATAVGAPGAGDLRAPEPIVASPGSGPQGSPPDADADASGMVPIHRGPTQAPRCGHPADQPVTAAREATGGAAGETGTCGSSLI